MHRIECALARIAVELEIQNCKAMFDDAIALAAHPVAAKTMTKNELDELVDARRRELNQALRKRGPYSTEGA